MSLRKKFEALQYEKDQAIADAACIANEEIKQLQETIAALRGELEKTCYENELNIVAAVTSAKDEIKQLKDTVTSLRQELEENDARHEEALQKSCILYR